MRGRDPDPPLGSASRPEAASAAMPGDGPDALGAASAPAIAELAELAREAGLRRVGLLAWRDIDDAEAGGSELHAHEVATRWAAAGTAAGLGTPSCAGRAGLGDSGGGGG